MIIVVAIAIAIVITYTYIRIFVSRQFFVLSTNELYYLLVKTFPLERKNILEKFAVPICG